MANSLVLNRRPKVPAEDTAAFGAIAERFRRAGALEQAVSLCRDGLKKFPDHVSARVTLGWSLLDLGKYDEARTELEQVMRRAPDNLAAIRGLAELHDRFEHTLNLPMDGPGQWPPPAESVEPEALGDTSVVNAVAPSSIDTFEAEPPIVAQADLSPSMSPAEMGLPLWTPEASTPETPAAYVAEPTAPGAAMGSMRDPFAGSAVSSAPESVGSYSVQTAEPVVENSASVPVEELGVSDPTLAALIAEADSLDAVAELQGEDSTFALDLTSSDAEAPIELSASGEDPVAALEAEVSSDVQLTAAMAAVEPEVAEPVMLEAAITEVTVGAADPAAEVVSEAVADLTAEAVADVAAEVVTGVAADPEPEVGFEPVAAAVAVDLSSEVAPFEAIAEAPELTEVQEVCEEDVRPAAVIAFAPPAPAVSDAKSNKNAAVLAALERMLERVQARRLQLMAESVA